jgi:hypothetical protein
MIEIDAIGVSKWPKDSTMVHRQGINGKSIPYRSSEVSRSHFYTNSQLEPISLLHGNPRTFSIAPFSSPLHVLAMVHIHTLVTMAGVATVSAMAMPVRVVQATEDQR